MSVHKSPVLVPVSSPTPVDLRLVDLNAPVEDLKGEPPDSSSRRHLLPAGSRRSNSSDSNGALRWGVTQVSGVSSGGDPETLRDWNPTRPRFQSTGDHSPTGNFGSLPVSERFPVSRPVPWKSFHLPRRWVTTGSVFYPSMRSGWGVLTPYSGPVYPDRSGDDPRGRLPSRTHDNRPQLTRE